MNTVDEFGSGWGKHSNCSLAIPMIPYLLGLRLPVGRLPWRVSAAVQWELLGARHTAAETQPNGHVGCHQTNVYSVAAIRHFCWGLCFKPRPRLRTWETRPRTRTLSSRPKPSLFILEATRGWGQLFEDTSLVTGRARCSVAFWQVLGVDSANCNL